MTITECPDFSRHNQTLQKDNHPNAFDDALREDLDNDRTILYPNGIRKATDIDVTFDKARGRDDKTTMTWSLSDDDRRHIHPEYTI